MMFWNYLIAPIYMGYPREAIVELLLPVFLPFNLVKGGLDTAITLRRSNMIEGRDTTGTARIHVGVAAAALVILIICITLIFYLRR